jgi:cephalosporin hydroxylase
MSAVSITAANVIPSADADFRQFTAGEAVTRGIPVYLKASDQRVWKAGSTTAALATPVGIVGNDAAAGQPVTVIVRDSALTYGAVLTAGQTYVPGATAGTLVPVSDEFVSGHYVGLIGQAASTSTLRFDLRLPVAGILIA